MRTVAIHSLAKNIKPAIGAHYRLLSSAGYSAEKYAQMRRASDEAVSLARYLIMHLADRHDAVRFANAVGMPGYINHR